MSQSCAAPCHRGFGTDTVPGQRESARPLGGELHADARGSVDFFANGGVFGGIGGATRGERHPCGDFVGPADQFGVPRFVPELGGSLAPRFSAGRVAQVVGEARDQRRQPSGLHERFAMLRQRKAPVGHGQRPVQPAARLGEQFVSPAHRVFATEQIHPPGKHRQRRVRGIRTSQTSDQFERINRVRFGSSETVTEAEPAGNGHFRRRGGKSQFFRSSLEYCRNDSLRGQRRSVAAFPPTNRALRDTQRLVQHAPGHHLHLVGKVTLTPASGVAERTELVSHEPSLSMRTGSVTPLPPDIARTSPRRPKTTAW